MRLQKIIPFLWFNNNAEEAMDYYTDIFKNSGKLRVTRYQKGWPGPEGAVMSAIFELEGQQFYALNGGSVYSFSPAISLFINCDTQEEIDHYWARLLAGGKAMACGWLTDKFGVTWQVAPVMLNELLDDADTAKANRVMQAMMKMVKLDIQTLEEAARG